MSDDSQNKETEEKEPQKTEETEFSPITSQEQLDQVLGQRLARERAKFSDYDDLKNKAAKFDEQLEAEKTELQKASERADQLQAELETERLGRLRVEVANSKGLPASLAARLQGGTQEELEADADALAKLIPSQQAQNTFRDSQGKSPENPIGDWLRDSIASR